MSTTAAFLVIVAGVVGQSSELAYVDTFSSGIAYPARLAPAGGGGVYVTDPPQDQVVEYDGAGGIVASYPIPEGPIGIAAHVDERVFISRADGAIGVYDATFALLGTVDATPMTMTGPNGLAFDPAEQKLYAVDSAEHRVLVFEEAGGSWTLATAWGMEGAGLKQFQSPQAIAVDPFLGHVLVADTDNARVQVFSTTGVTQFAFGYRTLYVGSTEATWFARTEGIAVDDCSNIYLSDAMMGTVRVFDANGHELDPTFAPVLTFGASPNGLRSPCDVAVDAAAGRVFVASTSNAAIEVFNFTCSAAAMMASAPPAAGDASTIQAKRVRKTVPGAWPSPFRGQAVMPDDPTAIARAIKNQEYSLALDLNFDEEVDVGDLEIAVDAFGAGTVESFMGAAGASVSHPGLEPPHIIDIANRCGRCHSMDDAPDGGMLASAGQENLCVSCHSAGKIANSMPIAAGDTENNHPWGVSATSGGVMGPAAGSELALHLDEGNIRCGTCHEPHELDAVVGYLRPAEDRIENKIELCAECHVEHAQWLHAGHADETAEAFVHYDWALPNRAACRYCHSGNGFVDYSEGLPSAQQNGAFRVHDCLVCHATHGKPQGDVLLRIYDEVTLPTEGPDVTVTGVGAMATCMACHNGRRAPDDGSLTPHYLLGGVMLEGLNANDFGFTLVNSMHTQIDVTCMDCHMAPSPAPGNPGSGKVGEHTFNLKVHDPDDPDYGFENVANACQGCHTGLDTINRPAGGDYDGDGDVEGIQDETQGVMDVVEAALAANGAIHLGGYPYWDLSGVDPAVRQTVEQAIWNFEYVVNSGDLGVKNTAYAVGMLQVAYRALTGVDVPGAVLRYVP